jgi:hypothetical protein
MNRRIDSRSTPGRIHAPSHDNASKQKLLASTLNLPWLRAVASKFKSGAARSEIWLRVKYQKGRGHPQLSNRYLLVFIRSIVQILWLFARRRVAETAFLGRLQPPRKIKIWGCSGGIILLSWIPKSWKTLPSFHRLLIQPHRTNGLDVTEFCASAKLLKTELDSITVGRNKIPKAKRKWNSRIAEYHPSR